MYGPTIISEDAKTNIVIRHIPESEEDSFVGGGYGAAPSGVTKRNSYVGCLYDGGETQRIYENAKDNVDTADSHDKISKSPLKTPPVVPPRRDLKPTINRRPISIHNAITRPISSFFGSNYSESNRGSFVGSIGSRSPSQHGHSPFTPSSKQRGFNFILDPSPPAIMTRKQSRDEIAMVRNALKQNAYARVMY